MLAPFPARHSCGARMRRNYNALPVIFNAPGFYETDVRHFEKQIGKEKAERLRVKNEDVMRRAKAGRLTPYEKRLDALEKANA